MAIAKQFADQPLQVVDTPSKLERIARIAAVEHVSKASVVRDCTDLALAQREAQSRERYPERWS